jgi:sugar lactone lactonase YvrE
LLRFSLIGLAVPLCALALAGCERQAKPEHPSWQVVLTGLDNPRGVTVGPAGELFVVEAGTGYAAVDATELTGRLTKFIDLNGDGDFDDEDEAEPWFRHLPTYNALHVFATGRDEVSGPGDILLHRDGRTFLTVDGGFENLALYEISPDGRVGRNLSSRSNMNGITFDLEQEHIYVVESTLNRLIEVPLDGPVREIVVFPSLDSGQQPVPAGLALDPQTGDVLVALFSGAVVDDESGEVIPFVSGDAKIVRVDPDSGEMNDEITGLTTAVDVAIDKAGNILVVEMASTHADLLPRMFDLFDRDAPPLHGGYQRFSGRVTLYPAGDDPARVIADRLDMPTNITLAPDGALYVSTGQGTPARPIPGPDGPTRIEGEVVRITNYLGDAE